MQQPAPSVCQPANLSADVLWHSKFFRESYPPTVYYNETGYMKETIKKESDIGPTVTHVYYLTNRGPATIQEAEVFLLWPSTTVGGMLFMALLLT